jgi:hypothetical protein
VSNNVRQTASFFSPKSIGALLFLGFVVGIVGVVAGWWPQSDFNTAAGMVLSLIWEGLKVAGSCIKFLFGQIG